MTPFARDIDGNLQCVDPSGQVVTWDSEDKSVMEKLGCNLGQYLEFIRDKLLTGKCVYEEGLGVVSVQ